MFLQSKMTKHLDKKVVTLQRYAVFLGFASAVFSATSMAQPPDLEPQEMVVRDWFSAVSSGARQERQAAVACSSRQLDLTIGNAILGSSDGANAIFNMMASSVNYSGLSYELIDRLSDEQQAIVHVGGVVSACTLLDCYEEPMKLNVARSGYDNFARVRREGAEWCFDSFIKLSSIGLTTNVSDLSDESQYELAFLVYSDEMDIIKKKLVEEGRDIAPGLQSMLLGYHAFVANNAGRHDFAEGAALLALGFRPINSIDR